MPKLSTTNATIKQFVEFELDKKKYLYTRKNHGLRIDLLVGNPEIHFDDDGLTLNILSNTSGFHGSKCYDILRFDYGCKIQNPEADIQDAVTRLLKALGHLKRLIKLADNRR